MSITLGQTSSSYLSPLVVLFVFMIMNIIIIILGIIIIVINIACTFEKKYFVQTDIICTTYYIHFSIIILA